MNSKVVYLLCMVMLCVLTGCIPALASQTEPLKEQEENKITPAADSILR